MEMDQIKQIVKGQSVFIAVPSIDGKIEMSCSSSIYQAQHMLSSYGVKNCLYQAKYDSLVTRARDMCAMAFLESDYTHMMFVDSDIDFSPDSILRLLLTQKDLIGAGYPKKEINWEKVRKAALAGVTSDKLAMYSTNTVLTLKKHDGPYKVNTAQAQEVTRLGTGFMLIKREVFERQIKELPLRKLKSGRGAPNGQGYDSYEFFGLSVDANDLRLSEDYHFCDMCNKIGIKVYAHPGIELGHTGKFRYTGDFARSLGVVLPDDLIPAARRTSALVTNRELKYITDLAKDKKAICELGVAQGETSKALLQAASPLASAWLIDTFDEKNEMDVDGLPVTPSLERAKQNIESAQSQTQAIYLIQNTTDGAAPDVPVGLDFLFIDADHTGDAPVKDFNNYAPKLAVGGTLVFHDANNRNKPVLEAVKAAKQHGSYEFIGQVDSAAAFLKISA